MFINLLLLYAAFASSYSSNYLDDHEASPISKLHPYMSEIHSINFPVAFNQIPDNYDARVDTIRYPTACSEVLHDVPRSSLRCGDCYSRSAAATFGIHYCRATGGKFNSTLSARHITTCNQPGRNGCLGGQGLLPCSLLHRTGIVSGTTTSEKRSGCQPDIFPYCRDPDPRCPKNASEKMDAGKCNNFLCDDNSTASVENQKLTERGYCKFLSWKSKTDIKTRQLMIMEAGPVSTYICGKEIENYRGGIIDKDTKCNSTHMLSIIGWQTIRSLFSTKVIWLGLNGWGTKWGENGYFRIQAGSNILQIEDSWIYPVFNQEAPHLKRKFRRLHLLDEVFHCFSVKHIPHCTRHQKTVMTTSTTVTYRCFPAHSQISFELHRLEQHPVPEDLEHMELKKVEKIPSLCRSL